MIIRILGSEFEVVDWVEDGREVLESALRLRPQAVILDISLPGVSGMILLPQLRRSLPTAGIVMLTNHVSQTYVDAAYQKGADGYVLKTQASDALVSAIQRGWERHQAALV